MREKILKLLQSDSYHPMVPNQIFQLLNLKDSKEFTQLVKTLNQLEDEGEITHNSRGEYATFEKLNLAKGIIDVKDGGYAFVDTDLGGIFIKSDNINGAITYDEVLVEYYLDNLGRYEGKVVKIIKRNTRVIIGPVSRLRQKAIVRSIDSKIKLLVFIKEKDLKKAKVNDIVKVEITEYFPNMTADGKVVEVYGNKHLPGLDITSMVLSSGVPVEFPEDVRKEIKTIPNKIDSEAILQKNPKIRDLRDKLIITIDGDDAKDLDDAISLKKLDNGNYQLGVHIADVSFYVNEGTELNKEAIRRGTSIYLVDRVIPMLPHKLSNGICSLNEGVDRYAISCIMEINDKGQVVDHNIYPTVIRSSHRMTYNNVNAILAGHKGLKKKYSDAVELFFNMKELAAILRKKRDRRGAIDFDVDEAKVLVDDKGRAVDVVLRNRGESDHIIEEFMLCANETVAEHFKWMDVPFIYRIHEYPKKEKLQQFVSIAKPLGYTIHGSLEKINPHELARMIEESKGTPEHDIISTLLLRSMQKARYDAQCLGHFGLADEFYTHFTSPIRRYPDLLVHRLIRTYLFKNDYSRMNEFEEMIPVLAEQSSNRERIAIDIEREVEDMKKAEFMSHHVGEVFDGYISSITSFGFFVSLPNTIEGLVHMTSLTDDYYAYDEKNLILIGEHTGRMFKMSDPVKVRVTEANKLEKTIDFELVKAGSHRKKKRKFRTRR